MIRIAMAAALLVGCIDDHYECQVDSDCNTGSGGRCELDHHCTVFDSATDQCTLQRRYADHSGPKSGECFTDAVTPLDLCATGSAPAVTTDPCAAAVCGRLPSCCNVGWSEACVQLAQVSCTSLACDTRIAITAENSVVPALANPPELFDLRLGGAQPTFTRLDNADAATIRKGILDWLAPAPGQTEPRLVGLDTNRANLLIDDRANVITVPVATDRIYDGLYSVDFDRDGRDKALLASYQVPDGQPVSILDLTTGATRPLTVPGGLPLTSWGDWDGDAYPDLVTATGGGQTYQLLHNIDDPDNGHTRKLDPGSGFSSGATAPTPGNVALQTFAWSDLDGDGNVDLIQLGAEARVHFGLDDRTPNSPRVQIDCNPLAVNPPATCVGTDVEVIGTPLVVADSVHLIVSIDDGTRNLYEVDFSGKSPMIKSKPLWSETCGVPTASMCPPIRLVIARDIDGDHRLDLVAIDATLNVFVLLANGGMMPISPPSIAPATTFKVVRASLSGAPR